MLFNVIPTRIAIIKQNKNKPQKIISVHENREKSEPCVLVVTT
jgi:hypothetical protein